MTGTRYKLEILHQCGKRVKAKSQKVLGANPYVRKGTGEKQVKRTFLEPLPPTPPLILNTVKKVTQNTDSL